IRVHLYLVCRDHAGDSQERVAERRLSDREPGRLEFVDSIWNGDTRLRSGPIPQKELSVEACDARILTSCYWLAPLPPGGGDQRFQAWSDSACDLGRNDHIRQHC